MTSLELGREAARLLDQKKARDIRMLEIKNISTLGDYFVVASGTSTTQVKAMADEVEFQLKEKGIYPKRVEGYQSAAWIVLDYYDVIIHVFCEETRQFYSLERLWTDAPQVDLSDILDPEQEDDK
ncbi:ribosome silencing factor [Harryflintia acetispora]|uniref:ribosome silencing factor n=1 Tax=Harryflintia acetispora TaxID=1849041 RepID=UPI001898BE24